MSGEVVRIYPSFFFFSALTTLVRFFLAGFFFLPCDKHLGGELVNPTITAKMPKSKRSKVFNLTQVDKKTREQKEKLFQNIRESIPKFQHCFVFSIDNMRNNYLKDVRRELSDSRYVKNTTKPFTNSKKKKTLAN